MHRYGYLPFIFVFLLARTHASGLPSTAAGTAPSVQPQASESEPQEPLQRPTQQQGNGYPKSTQETAYHDPWPAADWMTQCCSNMLLRQMFLPGTHDSGTYMWTTPKHMPLVLDEILTILFNIVGDLSRTQQLDVYQQLQAGARVLDIRLAVNPWLAVAARAKHISSSSSLSSSLAPPSTSHGTQSHIPRANRSTVTSSIRNWYVRLKSMLAGAAFVLRTPPAPHASPPAAVFDLDPVLWEGAVNMAAVGGPLNAAERQACIVTSHSLPGAPLVQVLGDVRRFLAENPGELVVLLVKADTIDVNVAGSSRFTHEDWAAAAAVFEEQLQGIQLVDERQVQLLTLGQLAAGSGGGGGSVLLYSSELQQQGLTAVSSRQARIVESWGNGTNTDDLGDLKQRLTDWLLFWRSANWRQNRKPFLLLASAEVTLGVQTILEMVKNRIWRWQQTAMWQQASIPAADVQSMQRALTQRQQLQQRHAARQIWPQLGARGPKRQRSSVGALTSGMTTLYQLGVETNKQMMQDVLGNAQVPKDFNVWSLDAISPDIAQYIIGLNTPRPTRPVHESAALLQQQ